MAPKNLHPAFKRVRNEILLDHTFFGGLVMHLDPVEDPKCALMWVDGKRVGFNPEKLTALLEETGGLSRATGLLSAGILKCCLEHPIRRGDRDEETWNEASDYVVNPLVLDSNMSLPSDARLDTQYKGMRAESVYDKIYMPKPPEDEEEQGGGGDDGDQQGGGGQGQQPGQGQGQEQGDGPPSCEVRDLTDAEGNAASPAEQSANSAEWQVNMQSALNNAQSRGDMPGGLLESVQQLLEPKQDWKQELARFAKSISKNDYSWRRGNRRYLHKRMYLPSAYSERVNTAVIVIDTSGSIGKKTLEAWSAEVNGLMQDVKPEKVIVIYCDARIQKVEEFSGDDFQLGDFEMKRAGGGGTSFVPPFEYLEEQGIAPDCLLYLTDLYGTFPEEPEFPVLWGCVNQTKAPWGETIYVEVN